jgi:hypothetical protein
MYNLFLDDFRSPLDCHYMGDSAFYFKTEWQIVRNYDEFVKFIETKWNESEFPAVVSFDHDLGDDHYGIPVTEETYESVFTGLKEKTGLDCAKWLINFCLEKGVNLPHFRVHSMNPIGAKNIFSLLENFRKFQDSEKL